MERAIGLSELCVPTPWCVANPLEVRHLPTSVFARGTDSLAESTLVSGGAVVKEHPEVDVEGAKTVDQALTVLLALEQGPAGAAELAKRTSLNRTVTHRMLVTLHSHGFVRRGDRGVYSLGAIFVRLASTIEPALRLASQAAMSELADQTGETAVLAVADHLDTVAIEQFPGRGHPLRVEYELASRRPIVRGASGLALLAFLDEAFILRATRTVDEPDDLLARLKTVREQGYAISRDELRYGVHGISVPVTSAGHAVASLSLIVPAQRGEQLRGHLDALLRAAARIEIGSSALTDSGTPKRPAGN